MSPIARLTRLARRLGGDIVQIPEERFNMLFGVSAAGTPPSQWHHPRRGYDSAPFTHLDLGTNYRQKVVYYSGQVDPGEVIHEMGHIFASRRTPNYSEEWDFFGWEYATARYLKLVPEWFKSSENYQLADGEEFGRLGSRPRQRLLREVLKQARERKLIDSQNRPLSVR